MSSEILQAPKLNLQRLLLLGVSSVILCLSYLMSIFSPFPIVMATLLYGRLKGYGIALLGVLLCAVIASLLFKDLTVAGIYALMVGVAFITSETLKRDWNPVKSIVVTGGMFCVLATITILGIFKLQNLDLKTVVVNEIVRTQEKIQELQKKSPADSGIAEVLIEKPEVLAQEMLENFPSYFVALVFFTLWANMYLSLKSRRMLLHLELNHYSENVLTKFKMPFAWIYIVIFGFVLFLGGKEYIGPWAPATGMTILRIVGIFYFFQGFGVLTLALDQFGIVGFFRTLFVMGIVLFAPYLIAGIGLFDNWFDFEKKLKKQYKE